MYEGYAVYYEKMTKDRCFQRLFLNLSVTFVVQTSKKTE